MLIAGGRDSGFNTLDSAELYDVGQGYAESRRPLISGLPSNLTEPSTMLLSGSGFRGDSEAASGSTSSSPTNYPLLRLQRIDNDQTPLVGSSAPWNDSTFTSATLSGLPNGYYRATIVTNGIPSIQRLVSIAYPAPVVTNISPSSGPTSGGQSVTITGTNLDNLWNVTIGGTIAVVTANSASSVTVTTPASNAGTVVLAVNTAGGTASGSYTYIFGPPDSITATAVSATSVNVSWPAVFSASSYDVARSDDGTNYTIVTSTNGTSVTDYAVAPNTSYLYKVRANVMSTSTTSAYTAPDLATTVIFTDATLSGVPVRAAHITELRTAVNAVLKLAGMSAATFTDATLMPGVTTVKAAHVSELRSNLDAARSKLDPTPRSYTDPSLDAHSTVIKAQHILDLRNGVQ